MTREQLEHIIRACADITNQYEFIIVGSQSFSARNHRAASAHQLALDR